MAAQGMKPGNFAMNISGGDYLDKPVLDQYGEECIIFLRMDRRGSCARRM